MGVEALMGCLEVGDVEVGVDLGGVEAGVAEHFLDDPDVGTGLVHVGGAGMAEEVAGTGFGDSGEFESAAHPGAEVGGGEAGGVAGEEEGGFVRNPGHSGAGVFQIAVEPAGGPPADGEQAGASALALADEEGPRMAVVVAEVELDHLGSADAGGVEEFEDRPVAQSEGAAEVLQGDDVFDFDGRKGFGELAGLFAGKVEIGGRICGDVAVPAEAGEEAPDATEPGELGIDGKWLSGARGAVLEEVELVGFQIGAGERGGADEAPGVAPCGELAERPVVHIDGRRGERAGFEVGEEALREVADGTGGWSCVECGSLPSAFGPAEHAIEISDSCFSRHGSRFGGW